MIRPLRRTDVLFSAAARSIRAAAHCHIVLNFILFLVILYSIPAPDVVY